MTSTNSEIYNLHFRVSCLRGCNSHDLPLNSSSSAAGPAGTRPRFSPPISACSVALVDPEANPGGVCVYRGCIPSKALLHVAKLIDERATRRRGASSSASRKIDLAKLREFKNNVVKRLTGGTGQLVKHRKVQYIQGLAAIVDPHTLRVKPAGGGEDDAAVRARDSRDRLGAGDSADAEGRRSARDGLDRRARSARHPEVAAGRRRRLHRPRARTVYAALGSAVTVVEMTPGLLPGADRDLVDVLAKRVDADDEGACCSNTRVVADEGRGATASASTFEGEGVEPRRSRCSIACSCGRPAAELERFPASTRTRVQVDERGFIVVDEQRRTDEPSIFAIGDVVGEPMLAHKASHEGRVAVEVIAGENVAFAPRAIPAVVFTDPELAWAASPRRRRRRTSRTVAIAKFPWGASGRAITLDRTDGLTKLILDPRPSGFSASAWSARAPAS